MESRSLTRPRNRTNASPIYLILFISAAYVLNRPCVYCSLLLAILVIALFDFSAVSNGSWFEPRYEYSAQHGSARSTNSTHGARAVADVVDGAMSVVASAFNATASMAVDALATAGKKSIEENGSTWAAWARRVWRSGLRVDCLGVTIRL